MEENENPFAAIQAAFAAGQQPQMSMLPPQAPQAAHMPMVMQQRTVKQPLMSPTGAAFEDARLGALLQASQLDSIKQQKSGIEELQARRQQLEQAPRQMDLSPLLALADSWTGSSLLRGYNKPESAQDRQGAITKLDQAIQQGRNDLTDKDIDLIKAKLSAKSSQAMGSMLAQDRLAAQQERQDALASVRTNSDVLRLKDEVEPMQNILDSISSVEDRLGRPLNDFDDKTGKWADGTAVDLPGVNIKGVGNIKFYNNDAQMLDTTLSRVFNVELKTRSGAAVSSRELQNLKEEFAQGKFNTEEQKLAALKQYRDLATRAMQRTEAAFNPHTRNTYLQQGGVLSEQMVRPASGADLKSREEKIKFLQGQ